MMPEVKRTTVVILMCLVGWIILPLEGQTNSTVNSGQQLILDKLANIDSRLQVVESTQKMILRELDNRFEMVDKRFEQVDKRFEQVDKRFGDMMNYIMILVVAFGSMTGLTIGFALWDRRTMIRPFESKVKEIEETIDKTQERIGNTQRVNDQLICVLKEYAKKDRKFAEIIKGFNIF